MDKEKIRQNLQNRIETVKFTKDLPGFLTAEEGYLKYVGSEVLLQKLAVVLLRDNISMLAHLISLYENNLPDWLDKAFVDSYLRVQSMEQIKRSEKLRRSLYYFQQNLDPHVVADQNLILEFHNSLLERLNENNKPSIAYDTKTNILSIADASIKFTKRPSYILSTLFKKPKEVWGFGDIAHDWSEIEDYDKNDWGKYYQASREVNEKITKETMIKDFLLLNTKQVQINPKYL